MGILPLQTRQGEIHGTVEVLGPSEEAVEEMRLKQDFDERKRRAEERQRKRDILEAYKRERVALLARIEELEGDDRNMVLKDNTGRSPSGLVVGPRISSLAIDKKRALAQVEFEIEDLEQELETG
jgi:hypothetical protein